MRRRDFMMARVSGATAACVLPHHFEKYDFGSGPVIQDRLNQGPFPADLYPSWTAVMRLMAEIQVKGQGRPVR